MSNAMFWLSWQQEADPKHGLDSRPVKWPPPPEVLGFWESGFAGDGSYSTVVALVRAKDMDDAARIVTKAWSPGVGEWRFGHTYDGTKPPGDRFPPCEWSVKRGTWPWPVAP
jgi:hypothetical protein